MARLDNDHASDCVFDGLRRSASITLFRDEDTWNSARSEGLNKHAFSERAMKMGEGLVGSRRQGANVIINTPNAPQGPRFRFMP